MLKVGFDIGGTNIKAGLVDESGNVISRQSMPFPFGDDIKAVRLMADAARSMAREQGLDPLNFKSIGIAAPGSINKEETMILNAHNLGFHHVPVKAEMMGEFPGAEVYLANDADAAALAEYYAGALKGCRNAVLITLGTGVGGGIIMNGKLFRGGMGNGSELGHMIIHHGGETCTCGNRGCIDALCSATWLIRQAKKSLVSKPDSLIFKQSGGEQEQLSAKLVIDCAKEGDAAAKRIFNRYISYLASAVISLTSILDPEVIAIGGGVSLAGDFLFEPLRKIIRKKSFFKVDYQIVPAQLGNDAGIIGAAMLGENKIV